MESFAVSRILGDVVGLEPHERRLDVGVRQQRAAPVLLERQQALREIIAVALADEIPAVLPQYIDDSGIRIPSQGAPEDLVDVVVHPLGIGDKAGGVRCEQAEDPRVVLFAGTQTV